MIDQRRQELPRVVSLLASATEILHAIGGGALQVARSHECDWPPDAVRLPAITRPKFSIEGSSLDIDIAVRRLIEQSLAIYEVDADALRAARPDVILTQDQCAVCAVSVADVQRAVAQWTDCTAHIVSLKPHTLADIAGDTQRIADAVGCSQCGAARITRMKTGFAAIAETVSRRPRPRLAFIEWIEPLMSCGHWMPELIALAGGDSLFGRHGAASPWISMRELSKLDPDIILVAPCGYGIAKTNYEMRRLDADATWQSLRAVRSGQVFVADGNAFFNRPGPRLLESAEILAEILHPGIAAYKHLGVSVVRYTPL